MTVSGPGQGDGCINTGFCKTETDGMAAPPTRRQRAQTVIEDKCVQADTPEPQSKTTGPETPCVDPTIHKQAAVVEDTENAKTAGSESAREAEDTKEAKEASEAKAEGAEGSEEEGEVKLSSNFNLPEQTEAEVTINNVAVRNAEFRAVLLATQARVMQLPDGPEKTSLLAVLAAIGEVSLSLDDLLAEAMLADLEKSTDFARFAITQASVNIMKLTAMMTLHSLSPEEMKQLSDLLRVGTAEGWDGVSFGTLVETFGLDPNLANLEILFGGLLNDPEAREVLADLLEDLSELRVQDRVVDNGYHGKNMWGGGSARHAQQAEEEMRNAVGETLGDMSVMISSATQKLEDLGFSKEMVSKFMDAISKCTIQNIMAQDVSYTSHGNNWWWGSQTRTTTMNVGDVMKDMLSNPRYMRDLRNNMEKSYNLTDRARDVRERRLDVGAGGRNWWGWSGRVSTWGRLNQDLEVRGLDRSDLYKRDYDHGLWGKSNAYTNNNVLDIGQERIDEQLNKILGFAVAITIATVMLEAQSGENIYQNARLLEDLLTVFDSPHFRHLVGDSVADQMLDDLFVEMMVSTMIVEAKMARMHFGADDGETRLEELYSDAVVHLLNTDEDAALVHLLITEQIQKGFGLGNIAAYVAIKSDGDDSNDWIADVMLHG